MKHPPKFVPPLVLLLLLAGGYYLYSTGQLTLPSGIAGAATDTVSGFIEGDETTIAAEVGGRIQELTVGEGDQVKAGQVIARLDRTLLDAQIAQAQAAVDTARAQLAQIKAGPRTSDVTAARAALDAAQQNYDKVRGGATEPDLNAAQAALQAAQQAYARVQAGPTADQLALLKAQVDNAQAALNLAQAAYDKVGGAANPNIGLMPQSVQLQQATNAYTAAFAAYNDARSHPTAAELAAAQAQVQQAQAALARLTADAAQLAAARSGVQQAQAALDRLTPTAESIAVAEALVKQAEAAIAVLQVQMTKLTVNSPVAGLVTRRVVDPGEIAGPNAALMTLVTLDPVKMTVYVPETEIGLVKVGDTVQVQVDSFPGRVFDGQVIYISPEAEFTPRNVQTKSERVNQVFAVRVRISNPGGELKPGMPADARFK